MVSVLTSPTQNSDVYLYTLPYSSIPTHILIYMYSYVYIQQHMNIYVYIMHGFYIDNLIHAENTQWIVATKNGFYHHFKMCPMSNWRMKTFLLQYLKVVKIEHHS